MALSKADLSMIAGLIAASKEDAKPEEKPNRKARRAAISKRKAPAKKAKAQPKIEETVDVFGQLPCGYEFGQRKKDYEGKAVYVVGKRYDNGYFKEYFAGGENKISMIVELFEALFAED